MNEFDNEAPSMLARNSTYSQGLENFDASFMMHMICSISYAEYVLQHETLKFEIPSKLNTKQFDTK